MNPVFSSRAAYRASKQPGTTTARSFSIKWWIRVSDLSILEAIVGKTVELFEGAMAFFASPIWFSFGPGLETENVAVVFTGKCIAGAMNANIFLREEGQ